MALGGGALVHGCGGGALVQGCGGWGIISGCVWGVGHYFRAVGVGH